MKRRLVIGSRGSRLALIQAKSVAAMLEKNNPGFKVEIKRVITQGDRDRRTPLERFGGAGIFVKELEEALLDRTIDLAVHSLKDVPSELHQGLRLVGVTKRADPRDVLIAKVPLTRLYPGATIGTDSLRRAVQLTHHRPDLKVCSIRGNVDTRLRKVACGELDGVILAAAGILRLGLEDRITEYLPVELFLPAVGQGALAIEACTDVEEVGKAVSAINHLPTWQSTTAERAFLRAVGGGCRAPIAALGTVTDATLHLQGMVADVESGQILRASMEGNAWCAEETGLRLAQKMLTMGASEFIERAKAG